MTERNGRVVSVRASVDHSFSKTVKERILLIAGRGVEGDAHCGETIKHRSRVAVDPNQPNLRQVHLMHAELFDALTRQGHALGAGDLGENITTRGVDLLALPRGTILKIGAESSIELTGLRNPCAQIEAFQSGLLQRVVRKSADGSIRRLAGVMAIVLVGGAVRQGDMITVVTPNRPHFPLERV